MLWMEQQETRSERSEERRRQEDMKTQAVACGMLGQMLMGQPSALSDNGTEICTFLNPLNYLFHTSVSD